MKRLKKILYVEDDPDIQVIAKLALETIGGFTVNRCSNGRQALARCSDFEPDLILLDAVMPEMDGHSTINALRRDANQAEIPVVFMTAKVMRDEVDAYRALGALDVIPKPFDPLTLADRVREIWDARA